MNPFDKLYCKLNRVTARGRHTGKVNNRELDDLCNAQVDLEQSGYTPQAKVEQRADNSAMDAIALLTEIHLADTNSASAEEWEALMDRACTVVAQWHQ